jgi:hypothetical protein
MSFEYTGTACGGIGAPGQCTGQSKAACPGAFLADETEGGSPVNCLGTNAGVSDVVRTPLWQLIMPQIRITFC